MGETREDPVPCASPYALGPTFWWYSDMMRDFLRDDAGQGLVEYSLIIALVAIVVIAALQLLGTKSNNSLMNTANVLS
jgi:pilus assembly protein Flp/PilA